MSRQSTTPPPPAEPIAPEHEYIEDTEAACVTAAHKLNVVLRLLRSLEDDGINDPREDVTDDGGYGLTTAQDLLVAIRKGLEKSVAAAEAGRQKSEDQQ